MDIKSLENIVEEEMKKQSHDVLEMRYINKENTIFERTQGGFLAMTFDGKKYNRVNTIYSFPFTGADEYISIREANEKMREIGMIKNLKEDVTKDQSELILEQLRLRYFTPVIEKIYDVKDEYGYAYFQVKTNFGKCKFTIHMNSGGVVSLSETHVLITDIDGNRYEIPDLNRLSNKELKKLDLYI